MSDIPIPSFDELVETFRKAEAEWAGHRPPVSRETHILAAVLPLVLRGTMEALDGFMVGPKEFEDILWGHQPDEAAAKLTVPLGTCRQARAVRDQIAALIGG